MLSYKDDIVPDVFEGTYMVSLIGSFDEISDDMGSPCVYMKIRDI